MSGGSSTWQKNEMVSMKQGGRVGKEGDKRAHRAREVERRRLDQGDGGGCCILGRTDEGDWKTQNVSCGRRREKRREGTDRRPSKWLLGGRQRVEERGAG